jgi:hypothetical protein
MRRWLWGFVAICLAACSGTAGTTPEGEPVKSALKNYGPAPELTNQVWLNVDAPLRLADLRGQVVLIDFWTFG